MYNCISYKMSKRKTFHFDENTCGIVPIVNLVDGTNVYCTLLVFG